MIGVKEYVFFDTNIYVGNNEKYDIVGEDYKILIKKCCQYCKVFSINVTYGKPIFNHELEHFQMHDDSFLYQIHDISDSNLKSSFSVGFEDMCKMREAINSGWLKFYYICNESCELLSNMADSIFSWKFGYGCVNAEDLTFYRSDGSVLFTSARNMCFLDLREGENFNNVLFNGRWLSVDGWKVSYIDNKLRSNKGVKFEE